MEKQSMPIMRVEITDVLLRTLRPPEKDRLEVWDTIVRELSIRLAPTGKYDEWAVRARQPKGKRIRTTLGGCWPRMSIKQARAQGRIKVGQIAGGRDPVAERRQAREAEAAKASMPTVKTRLGEWLDAHPEWSESYRRETERLCTKVIEPKLGDRPLRDTTREDWVALPCTAQTDAGHRDVVVQHNQQLREPRGSCRLDRQAAAAAQRARCDCPATRGA